MRTLKNSTESSLFHTFSGYTFPSNSAVDIPEVDADNMLDQQMHDWIIDGSIIVIVDSQELAPEIGRSHFFSRSVSVSSSLAVDKNGTDQTITNENWQLLTANRVIWDINGDYIVADNDFKVPVNAVYKFDGKIRVTGLVNVGVIELAVYKRGNPDDYWFIVDRQYPEALSLQEVILSGAIAFDMYKDELFCLKIKLTKAVGLLGISATIDGDDDYTAWGYTLDKLLPTE